jgi:tetratricopeptide (TPR) repeat protein/DNA-binding XRE family transcriptional regulator
MSAASHTSAASSRPSTRLGERLRQLRVAAGLTQSELAGERFSKEYVSQIERGKTRPTDETIGWLAARLGVDTGFLSNGVSSEDRGRVEATLARAEALLGAGSFADAAEAFEIARAAVGATSVPELDVRSLVGEARARIRTGEIREALDLLSRARTLAEGPSFSDVERAEVLLWLGACRYKLSSIQTALGLLNESLALAERSGLPCDRLRADVYNWRARCYRRQRDFEAAREDVETALELAEGLNDRRALANAYFQASLVAERQGHWLLARTYAERAKSQYEELADQANVGQLMNNLGGLNLLLGNSESAIGFLKDAFRVALELGNTASAAQAVSSLAQVHLRAGDLQESEKHARHALELLDERVDYLDEIGNAQLTLGRSLLEQDRLDEAGEAFAAAETSFEQLSSASHRAAAWVAKGDLAARRGDDRAAALLYRAAAEALQDFRF